MLLELPVVSNVSFRPSSTIFGGDKLDSNRLSFFIKSFTYLDPRTSRGAELSPRGTVEDVKAGMCLQIEIERQKKEWKMLGISSQQGHARILGPEETGLCCVYEL